MTDMTLSDLSAELRMYEGRPEGIHVDPSAFAVWADAIDAHLAKAAQGEVVAWLYSWHDPLHEAERTVVADACESRARQHADQHGATLIPLYAQPRPVGVPDGESP